MVRNRAKYLDVIVLQVDGDFGDVQKIIGKIFFDHVAFISEADDEVVDSVVGIYFHDVPENRFAADLDHRFGVSCSFLC